MTVADLRNLFIVVVTAIVSHQFFFFP